MSTRPLLPALISLFGAIGCHQQLTPPSIDSSAATETAFASLDKSADGFLSPTELESSPGLTAAFRLLDFDGSGAISRAELSSYLDEVVAGRVALTDAHCEVFWKGRPLPDAQVRYIPEPFLADVISTADGVTDELGIAAMSIENSEYPGVHLGLYKVAITHPEHQLPARFNSDTQLGCQAGATSRGSSPLTFDLR